jgi:hypothetical protein
MEDFLVGLKACRILDQQEIGFVVLVAHCMEYGILAGYSQRYLVHSLALAGFESQRFVQGLREMLRIHDSLDQSSYL